MARLADDLKDVPLFSGLSQRQLKRLARDFKEREFKEGAMPLREGKMSGIGFFVIADGRASVSIGGTKVARLGPGDYFGELGLICESARSATVTADSALRCLELAVWDFRRFIKETPDASWKLLQHVAGLLVEAEARKETSLDRDRTAASSK